MSEVIPDLLTESQARTLLAPLLPDQRKVFKEQYSSNTEFRILFDQTVREYMKDPMVIVAADASQAEVRMVASLSGEDSLIQMYEEQARAEACGEITEHKREIDLHYLTASKLYNKDIYSVSTDERRFAKQTTFALLYGAGEFKIANNNDISIGAAKKLLDGFWASYPKVRAWTNRLVAEAVQFGNVRTPFGRIKSAPTLKGKVDVLEAFMKGVSIYDLPQYSRADRNQIGREIRQIRNFPVQSFTSDMIVLGTWFLLQDCEEHGFVPCVHTIVHDSIVSSVRWSQVGLYYSLLKKNLEQKIKEFLDLKCPMKLEVEIGLDCYSEVELPILVKDIDWRATAEAMWKKWSTVESDTIITAAAANASYLFEDKEDKVPVLTSRELKAAQLTNPKLEKAFHSYRQKWDLTRDVLDEKKAQFMDLVISKIQLPELDEEDYLV